MGPHPAYTARQMKIAIPILFASLLLGCGGAPTQGGQITAPLQGEGLYLMRYNPPAALSDRMELCAEIKHHAGWERVALEDPSDSEGLIAELHSRFSKNPQSLLTLRGDLSSRIVRWGTDHGSRVLVLQDLDPPPEDEDDYLKARGWGRPWAAFRIRPRGLAGPGSHTR